jgi:hypothetical protein
MTDTTYLPTPHPAFGGADYCACGREAQLRERRGYHHWWCGRCGRSWVVTGSAMDIANELTSATRNNTEGGDTE